MRGIKFYCFFYLFFLSSTFDAQNIRIGIFNKEKINKFSFEVKKASYSIYADSLFLFSVSNKNKLLISKKDSFLVLKKENTIIGEFNEIKLVQDSLNSYLTVIPENFNNKKRNLNGDFKMQLINNELCLINMLDMPSYLTSVVLSEAGPNKPEEYYKVQVILSRTYALKHLNKHEEENFDLCDGVHCQVSTKSFNYKCPAILNAVNQTRDLIVVDSAFNLIGAFFHANCGGQTAETNQVWNKKIPYLTSFKDTFCVKTRQSTWTYKIPKFKWENYFKKHFFLAIKESDVMEKLYTFKQPFRKTFFINPKYGIPLRDIRSYFKLKSTFFDCFDEGDYVTLRGRGFGHGVGLCQEGAMEMAINNFTYDEIIRYYFPLTRIIKRQRIMK